ncbi:hypothetical protein POF50_013425 [Streptomyces sp. SL13]|uniref:Uncharacterized protein n=1 Tax=Streptantibioticus silvisoli TaxID=2705255 RepID=A0AA90K937_9ACTN|nr:hypothetical protein [Streptantibioticus silvisoli]MDI5963155.1 hypothetical protein [Streptantibioticus silvisoli]MDI5970332.1 hypothetical protein [Streptantibioticus silvisoli]
MGIAAQSAGTHVGVIIVAAIVLAGVIGMITTHKGNKTGRRTSTKRRSARRR